MPNCMLSARQLPHDSWYVGTYITCSMPRNTCMPGILHWIINLLQWTEIWCRVATNLILAVLFSEKKIVLIPKNLLKFLKKILKKFYKIFKKELFSCFIAARFLPTEGNFTSFRWWESIIKNKKERF